MSSELVRPDNDYFVAKLVKNPAEPPKTVLLNGYVGASSELGHTRLYLDLELNSYVEIPDDAILHMEPRELSAEHGHVVIFMVWIKRDARIKPDSGTAEAAKDRNFQSAIMEAYSAAAADLQAKAEPKDPGARARYFQGAIMQAYGAAAAEFQAKAEQNDPAKIGIKASLLTLCRTEDGLPCVPQLQSSVPCSLVDGCPSVVLWLCPSEGQLFCPPPQRSVDFWTCKTLVDPNCESQHFRVMCVPPG